MMGDGGALNYTEHSVVLKPTKKTRFLKTIIIAVAVAVFLAIAFLIITFASATIITLPMIVVLIVYAAFVFWKYTRIEYDYTIASGNLTMCVVYGGRKRKELFDIHISAADSITDFGGKSLDKPVAADKVYICLSSNEAKSIVCITFTDADGNNCAAYIEAEKKAKSVLKFYNSSAYRIL